MAREKELSPEELDPPWTVLKLLRWTAGYFEEHGVTQTPRLDADLLLGHVLDLERVELYARFDTEVDEGPRRAFRKLVKRRAGGEPVAYLVGRRSFWQMELAVDDRALIPRPETEVLVEELIEHIPEGEPKRVIDVGTGSGAVALAIAEERPELEIAATDLYEGALEVAAENVESHGHTDRIELFQGDLFEALPEDWGLADAIVSNPPYVPDMGQEDIQIEIRDHEPNEALFAGSDGLEVVSRLVPEAVDHLVEKGWLFVEVGHHQAEHVLEMFEEAGFQDVAVREDYGGHERVVRGRAPR